MADLNFNEHSAVAHPHLDEQIKALYAALKAMKPKDMTEAQFDIFVTLEEHLEEWE